MDKCGAGVLLVAVRTRASHCAVRQTVIVQPRLAAKYCRQVPLDRRLRVACDLVGCSKVASPSDNTVCASDAPRGRCRGLSFMQRAGRLRLLSGASCIPQMLLIHPTGQFSLLAASATGHRTGPHPSRLRDESMS